MFLGERDGLSATEMDRLSTSEGDLLCEPEGDCKIDRLLDIAVERDEDGLGVSDSEELEALCVDENVGEDEGEWLFVDEGSELWEIVG